MAKFRVYEIAKKYNKDNKEILEILKANHVEVKNHMSTIGDEQIKMIENALKPKKEAKQDHNSKKQENSKRKDNKKAQNMEEKIILRTLRSLEKIIKRIRNLTIKTRTRIRSIRKRKKHQDLVPLLNQNQ